jgi:aminoglycoside phosphotransferase family enzyme/predicted kinase
MTHGGGPPADLTTDLLRPDAYPAPSPDHVELRETHVSWVFMTEGEVYKVKKPVTFAFLDFGTLEARRRACEAELMLNSRLAVGTYLGLVPVRRDGEGRHHFHADGEVVDWAVHMLRLPDELRADERLAAGTLSVAHIDAAATMIADFHGRAPRDAATSRWGTIDAIRRNVTENFAEIDAAREGLLTPAQAREVETSQLGFLRDRARTFERRVAGGRICEGHGDLRLDHLYFGDEGELTIIDCLEFSERFRCADVCADIAFLSMDLTAHGRVDLAERLLARYARAADDYDLYSVVDFYEGYRAYVRGKVSALTAHQSTGGVLRDRAVADARRHFALALATARRSLLEPVVVAVGGVIASGKSTVAEALGDRLSAPVIDADRTRKHLLGLSPTTHDASGAFEGAYDPATTDRVYAELMQRASTVLESGRPVVLDASFRSEEMRRAARDLASEHGVPFLMVECRARPEVSRARLVRRERETSVSDGRLAIFDAFCARVEPWNELSNAERLVVDTERPFDATLAALDDHLRTWPAGLTS